MILNVVFQLFEVVHREDTLLNVIRSVTRNGRSILLTAVLAMILVYMFSLVGYIFFQDDFLVLVDEPTDDTSSRTCLINEPVVDQRWRSSSFAGHRGGGGSSDTEMMDVSDRKERACDSLAMCIITTLNQGLRNGGGIGDILRHPSSMEPRFIARVIYDLLFFFVVIIIVLNLIFGVIIDTFADLRSEKQQKDEILKDTCFICGLPRRAFDNKTVSFEEHINSEHNMWHYLYFTVLLKTKDPTEFTGPESYVYSMVKEQNLDWFPRMRAMSLVSVDGDGEQSEIKALYAQMCKTEDLVSSLATQLQDLKDQVVDQRKLKHRMNLLKVPAYASAFGGSAPAGSSTTTANQSLASAAGSATLGNQVTVPPRVVIGSYP